MLYVERLKEKLEECFGCEYELFIEFTGLIRSLSLLFYSAFGFLIDSFSFLIPV